MFKNLVLTWLFLSYFTFVNAVFRLQILHNNDLHSKFDETDAYGLECFETQSKANNCFGGFARMKQAADDAREEAKKKGIFSIFVNTGDTFMGSPYYTMYKWKIVQPLLDSLQLDAMTFGNHEFDDGIQSLVEFLKRVKTPTLACNLNLTTEKSLLVPQLRPSVLLQVGELKIGLVGYLTPDTMSTSHTENLFILNEIPFIQQEAQKLIREGANTVIAMGHSGFRRDIEIARRVPEISVVVGGHTHTFMYTPKNKHPSTETAEEVYPYIVTQKSGKKVPVVQAYCNTKYLGKLLLQFNDKGDVISAEGNPILLDSSIQKDKAVDDLVMKWIGRAKKDLKPVVGHTRVFLERASFLEHKYESNFGNLLADAVLNYDIGNTNKTREKEWTMAPIIMVHQGGIRCNIDNAKNNGSITMADIMTALPFPNSIVEIHINGSTIWSILEQSAATDKDMRSYLHFAGLKVVYDVNKPTGKKVQSVQVLCRDCLVPEYEPLELDKMYFVLVDDFIKRGADGYTMLEKQITQRNLNTTYAEVLRTYLNKYKIIYPVLEGRIINVVSPEAITDVSAVAVRFGISNYLLLFAILSTICKCEIFNKSRAL